MCEYKTTASNEDVSAILWEVGAVMLLVLAVVLLVKLWTKTDVIASRIRASCEDACYRMRYPRPYPQSPAFKQEVEREEQALMEMRENPQVQIKPFGAVLDDSEGKLIDRI